MVPGASCTETLAQVSSRSFQRLSPEDEPHDRSPAESEGANLLHLIIEGREMATGLGRKEGREGRGGRGG